MENQYEKKITWTIKNFSALPSEEIYSDQFVVGGSKWRLLAYPKGNSDGIISKCFSLFLDVADSKSLPSGWRRHTKYRLTVVEAVNSLFERHPDIASKFRPKNMHMRTTYLNSLLSLTEMLCQSPEELSIDDLADVNRTLSYLTKAGFKLAWLEKKLKEAGQNRLQEIEMDLKDLKQSSTDMNALLEFLR